MMIAARLSTVRRAVVGCGFSQLSARNFATEISVRHLPYSATAESVSSLLAERGVAAPSEVNIVVKGNGKATGRAYVKFDIDDDAEKAIAALSQEPFDGRNLTADKREPEVAIENTSEDAPFGGVVEDVFTNVRKALLASTDRSEWVPAL